MTANYSYLENDYWSSTSKGKQPKIFVQPPTGLTKDATISYKKFILLNLLTAGCYRIYWGWRLWESLRLTEKKNYRLRSSIRSLFLSISGIFLFPRLQRLAETKGYKAKYDARLIAWIYLLFPYAITVLAWVLITDARTRVLVDAALIVPMSILTSILLLPIVDMHNRYTQATRGKYAHTKRNKWLFVVLVLSLVSILWSVPFTYKLIASEEAFTRQSSRLTFAANNFSIDFPGKPVVYKHTSKLKSGQVVQATLYKKIYGKDNEHYDVAVYTWPTQVVNFSTMSPASTKQFLLAAVEGEAKVGNGIIFGNSYETLYSGNTIADNAQLLVHNSGKVVIEYVRILVIGQSEYDILSINAPKLNFTSFANSFSYLPPSANASLEETYKVNDCGGPADTLICPDSSATSTNPSTN